MIRGGDPGEMQALTEDFTGDLLHFLYEGRPADENWGKYTIENPCYKYYDGKGDPVRLRA